MGKGRLGREQAVERDQVEAALAALALSVVELEEVLLRNEQAMRRTPLVEEVLRPAVERIREVQASIRDAQGELSEVWRRRQTEKWKVDSR